MLQTIVYMVGVRASSLTRVQISNIRIIKEAMREASFLYSELVALGATMTTVDVGGAFSTQR